jgi:hypothetical protein
MQSPTQLRDPRVAETAVTALVLALVVAAIPLAPWRLKFAVDARELYDQLYQRAAELR